MDQILLTVPDAAESLDVSKGWLEKQINAGLLPIFRCGRLVRIRRTDLDDFVESLTNTKD